MKVLMYGWEFPPRISGGLGVACYAMVKELVRQQVDVALILPEIVADIVQHSNFSLFGCDSLTKELAAKISSDLAQLVDLHKIDFAGFLSPYSSFPAPAASAFNENRAHLIKLLNTIKIPEAVTQLLLSATEQSSTNSVTCNTNYGENLFAAVLRYGLLSGWLAREIPHDVIHAHDWLTILSGIEAKKHSQRPLIFHIHATEYDRSGQDLDQRIYAIEKYGMEQADQIIAVSNYTKNIIMQHYGIAAEKIVVVHNGIYLEPLSQFKSPNRQPMVLFVGRLTQQKNPECFIEIAKKVLEKKPNIQFVLAGAGDLFASLVEKVARLRLGKNIHFTGFLAPDEVKKIYGLADVYVMPSVSEPFGLSCLEALANNVPAVISKQSGVSEVLRHVLVADFWDVQEMAAKILALLEYQKLHSEVAINSWQDLCTLGWDKTAAAIKNLYAAVCGS